MAESGINGRRLLALLGLRAKLTTRQYSREPGRIVASAIAILFFAPLLIGLAIATGVGYIELPDPWPAQLLGIVLSFLWLAWIAMPIFAFNVNEGLDITRLLVYPLTRLELLLTMLMGTIFDFPTYIMLPMFGAVLYGWGRGLAFPLVIVALGLAYGQMVLASQLMLNVAGGILRSRRFRDLFILFTAIIGSSCFLIQQGIGQIIIRVSRPGQEITFQPLTLLQWLPPGALARAIERAYHEAWIPALLWLTYGGLWLAILGFSWWWVTTRVLTGQGFLLRLPIGQQKQKQQPMAPAGAGRLPPDLVQIIIKEWKLGWRTPRRRVALLQMLIMPLFMGLTLTWNMASINPNAQINRASLAAFSLPAYALFIFWLAGQNTLGWEGKGFHFLLLTPISRWRIFLAKGLATIVMSSTPLVLLSLILLIWSKKPTTLTGLPVAIGVGLTTLAISFITGTIFPFPIDLEGLQPRVSYSGGGCLSGLANFLLTPILLIVFNIPIALMFIYSRSLKGNLAFLVSGLGALVYGLLFFLLAIAICGWWLQQYEPEIVAATRPRQKS